MRISMILFLEAARNSTNKIKRVLAVNYYSALCTHLRVNDLIEQLWCLILMQ
jgi:hypothetical protein